MKYFFLLFSGISKIEQIEVNPPVEEGLASWLLKLILAFGIFLCIMVAILYDILYLKLLL
ncbi:MAG: hypothetical protein R3Y63_08625 [Eubacteriales bacterium]